MRGIILPLRRLEPGLFFVSPTIDSFTVTQQKVNSKSFIEKGHELGMLEETHLLMTSSILRSVRCVVSELLVEAFHATL